MTRLLKLELDDMTTKRLLNMARRHCKLVFEYVEVNTSLLRRKAIQGEIEALREARTALLIACQGREHE